MAQPKEIPKPLGGVQILAGTAEIRTAICDIVARAERTLAIVTPNLEPEIYEHYEFLDTVKRFVLSKSFARIRVLITQPERTMMSGNQFVQMGQRLNTYIQFQSLASRLRPVSEAYCIADADALVYRADHSTGEGIVDRHAPEIARRYLNEFEQFWHAS